MGLELMICEIVLHTALPSEQSTPDSWPNANLTQFCALYYTILSECRQIPYVSPVCEVS